MPCAPLPERVTESYHSVVHEENLKAQEARRLAVELILRRVANVTTLRFLGEVPFIAGRA